MAGASGRKAVSWADQTKPNLLFDSVKTFNVSLLAELVRPNLFKLKFATQNFWLFQSAWLVILTHLIQTFHLKFTDAHS